ncbi:MAG TPA: PEP/pyruvate-binding domain-containing protein, partial [Allocoleopsis sp.]
EALPGDANQVVSGKITPEQYQVFVPDFHFTDNWQIPEEVTLEVTGNGNVPNWLIQQVAYLSRHLEKRFHGIPQDIEWSYDGEKLWLLQSRPITTLTPIWTRKIAAEVIPGVIRPLTWSINQPLTCGVWGEIFTIVLGKNARNLDFNQTANLHYSHAYLNATLLGQIFLKMGLPAESLEFLTRGAKFNKPPLFSTLQNLPGLLRLMQKEMSLIKDFKRDEKRFFNPTFAQLNTLEKMDILPRINMILLALQKATYYSIMCPLSVALRQKIFKIKDEEIDNSKTPEIAVMRSLQFLVNETREFYPHPPTPSPTGEGEDIVHHNHQEDILETLAENPQGQEILKELDQLIENYGYLSQVGTDISVPTWSENPQI